MDRSNTEPHATSHPASAIKFKTSPTKGQSSEQGAKVISPSPKASQLSSDKKRKKATPVSAKKIQQQSESGSKLGKKDGEGDQFSAALDALSRISFSDFPNSVSNSTPVSAKLVSKSSDRKNLRGEESINEGQTKIGNLTAKEKLIAEENRKESKEELSPSVSAMFEAVKSGSQAGGSANPTVIVNQPESPREANTATLKSMLNIESPSDQKPYSRGRGRGKSPTSSPLKNTPSTPPRTSAPPIQIPPHHYHAGLVSSSPQNAPLLGSYYGPRPGQYHPPDLPESVRKLYRPPQSARLPQQPPLLQDFPRPPRPPLNVWRGTYSFFYLVLTNINKKNCLAPISI